MRRVVITGIGVTAPNGRNKEEFFSNTINGISGIGDLALFDARSFDVRIGGEVKRLDLQTLKAKYPETDGEKDRKILLGLTAFEEAIADAGLGQDHLRKAGMHFGLGLEVFHPDIMVTQSGIDIWEFCEKWARPGLSGLPQSPLDKTANSIINRHKCRGPVLINCSACAASAQAIGHSFHMVRSGRTPIVVAGGLDSMLNPMGVGGFSTLGALTMRNELGPKACRPFDASRDGTVLGEGSAVFIIEELSHALSRGAKPYVEIAGFGSTLDAYKVSDPEPEGEGAYRAMGEAMRDAGIAPKDVRYINAHGTGTPKNDVTETLAIKRLFEKDAYDTPVSSTKSMIGHLIAASGAVELAATIIPFQHGFIPPTINLDNPDPKCDLDYVPDIKRKFSGEYAMSNSFGFGGQNACIVLRRFK